MASGIYQIKNIINGRFYVGSSLNVARRKNDHFRSLHKNKHDNPYLQADFNKCGPEAFEYVVLCFCSADRLVPIEQMLLDKFWDKQDRCYNINPKADRVYWTPEMRQKAADRCRNQKHSPETRRKMSQSRMGNKNGVGNKNTLGRKCSEATRIKLRAAWMRRKANNLPTIY